MKPQPLATCAPATERGTAQLSGAAVVTTSERPFAPGRGRFAQVLQRAAQRDPQEERPVDAGSPFWQAGGSLSGGHVAAGQGWTAMPAERAMLFGGDGLFSASPPALDTTLAGGARQDTPNDPASCVAGGPGQPAGRAVERKALCRPKPADQGDASGLSLGELFDQLTQMVDVSRHHAQRIWRLSIQFKEAVLAGTSVRIEAAPQRTDIRFEPGSLQAERELKSMADPWSHRLSLRAGKVVSVTVLSTADPLQPGVSPSNPFIAPVRRPMP